MSEKKQSVSADRTRKGECWILAFFWIAGLVFGMAVYCSAADALTALIHSSVNGVVSMAGLLCGNVLPVLLSAIAVFLSAPAMVFTLCFGKAFLCGFVSLGVLTGFGSAGWLCRGLLLFSSCLTQPVLYWYWLRCLDKGGGCFAKISSALTALALEAGICCFDFCIISPYLACLIDF